MVRRSLIVAALLAVSSPLAAQEEWVWTSDRPDGATPIGVFGARTLGVGEVQLTYQWIQRNSQGIWFGKDSLDLATTLQLYEVAPLSLSDKRHSLQIAYGVSDKLTVRGRGEFALIEREQLRDDGTFYIMSANALGDVQVDATYNLIRQGPYRMDVNGGVLIPIGKSATYATSAYAADEATPYDMRPGAGSFGLVAGMSADVQNEVGSVGAQFKLRTYLNENSRSFTLGDRYEASAWAAYNLNSSFSISGGIRWEKWGNIDGADDYLDTIFMRDPYNQGVFLSGVRAMFPIGLNFIMPEGSSLEGHRLSFETVYALHHDYDFPQMGLDWGINIGWVVPF